MKITNFFKGFIVGISCALLALALAGCTEDQIQTTSTKTPTLSDALALIVGVADGKVAGPCLGSDVDANTFATICADKGIPYTPLINSAATVSTVKNKLQSLCATYGTVIFYFSGHGGQTKAFNPYVDNEDDGKNEFLCLYDAAMLDNDIWQIISKAKGRVICIFDCCHSGSMWRAPMFTDRIKFGAPIITNVVDAVNAGGIFVLSGSPDSDYSYGAADGGKLTNAIRKHYKNKTYADLFDILENDKQLRSFQRPVCTVINGFDTSIEFLK